MTKTLFYVGDKYLTMLKGGADHLPRKGEEVLYCDGVYKVVKVAHDIDDDVYIVYMELETSSA